eukprot:11825211-Karenia_brevis.AAC.1
MFEDEYQAADLTFAKSDEPSAKRMCLDRGAETPQRSSGTPLPLQAGSLPGSPITMPVTIAAAEEQAAGAKAAEASAAQPTSDNAIPANSAGEVSTPKAKAKGKGKAKAKGKNANKKKTERNADESEDENESNDKGDVKPEKDSPPT